MVRMITSVAEFHQLDLETRLQINWPGNERHGQIVLSNTGPDGYESRHYVDLLTEDGEEFVIGADIFEQGGSFIVLT